MEAPELINFCRRWGLGFVGAVMMGVMYPLPAQDYEISAHAALTSAIIDTYNAAYPDQEIDALYRFDLIRGSKEEDDGLRPLNHFYDPIRNRGLSFKGKNWMRSKGWAVADDVNDFTWGAGLDAYARGDYNRAFLLLGHILHLLEDAAVPEHVRNDPHVIESPYENFTKTLVPAKNTAGPLVRAHLNDYFDAMARYTNTGFYSADTIDDGAYAHPKPDYVLQEGKYTYGFKTDEDGNKYRLVHYIKTNKYSWSSDRELKLINKDDNKILTDYWRLLSAKVIRYGAGMTHTFITEGEQLKKERAAIKKKTPHIYNALASVANVLSNTTESVAIDDGLIEAERISLDDDAPTTAVERTAPSAVSKQKTPAQKPTASAKTQSSKKSAVKRPPPKACVYAKKVSPTHGPVIINEVAWMGSKASASDEWIELKNISRELVVIDGWQLLSKRGNISAVLPAGATIPAGSFYILERTDDAAVPHIPADFIYIGSLANSDDGLRLVDGNCTVADDVVGDPSWPAGSATDRRTMERAIDFSWHDYTGSDTQNIFGTPRADNSPAPLIKAGSAQGGSSSSVSPTVAAPTPSSAQTASAIQSISAQSAPQFARGDVLINELLFDAAGSDTGNEFIELYNPTDTAIDLTGWSVQVQSGVAQTIKKKNFDDGLTIPAYGCFLAWLGVPPQDVRPQFIWSSGTLHNTAATIYIRAHTDEFNGVNDTHIIDTVSYDSASIPGFAAGMSVERVGETSLVRARQSPSPGSCVRLADDEPVPSSAVVENTEKSNAPFNVPRITAYKNPHGAGTRIDVAWTDYPFIPQTNPSTWTGIIFYLNRAPDGGQYLVTDNRLASGSDAALKLQYPNIRSGSFPMENMLVLPDVVGRMTTDNGLHSYSYNYYTLTKDNAAYVTTPKDLEKGDYITAGYYRFWGSGGGSQTMELVFADTKKIYVK